MVFGGIAISCTVIHLLGLVTDRVALRQAAILGSALLVTFVGLSTGIATGGSAVISYLFLVLGIHYTSMFLQVARLGFLREGWQRWTHR